MNLRCGFSDARLTIYLGDKFLTTFTPTVFSVSIGGFQTAELFGSVFQINPAANVEFTDDDGILSRENLAATTVRFGDDSQGGVTGIFFRTITLQVGESTVSVDVAFIERQDVADYLIVPIDRDTGRITNEPLDLGNYAPGEVLVLNSVDFNAVVEEDPEPPVAVDDTATVAEDGSVTLDLLSNDTDANDDVLSVASVSDPANGSVQLVNGVYVYSPDANFNGEDTFDYTVSDGGLETTGSITVTVTPVNDIPSVGDDTASTDEDTAVDIDVLDNDSDVETDLSVSSFSQPANGTVVLGNNGQLRYTPDADFSGEDMFSYAVFDGDVTVGATVTVTVNPVNDAPEATDGAESVNEDQSVVIDLSALVSDVDSSDLTIDAGDPGNGDLADNGDGTFTYTPDADYNGNDSFTYSVSDGELSAGGTVSIDVAAVNDAPVAEDDDASTDFETATTIEVLNNDDDPESDNLTITGITGVAVGLVAISADGKSIEYTPADGFSGDDSFGYILSDGTATDEAEVTVTVGEPGNRAPVAANDTAEVSEDGSISISVTENDTDQDDDDLSIFGFTQGENGSVGLDGEGGVLYTPNANFEGEDSFTYAVSDGSLTDTGTVTVTVNGVNDAPVAIDAEATTDEDTSTVINILALISDLDSESLDLDVGEPSNGMIEDIGDGLYRYTPDSDFNGSDSVTFTVSDGSLVDQGMINIFVEAANDAPVAEDDIASTPFETSVDIDVLDNDTDVEGDDLTVTGITGNPDGEVVIAADGKSVTYTPADGFSGEDSFGYILSDGTASDDAQVTVTVEAQDELPPVAADDTADTSEDTPVAIDVLGNDTDGNDDDLSIVSFTDGASGSVAENDDGELVYTPDADTNGEDSFTYTITDGTTESTATVTVDVAAVNDPVEGVDDSESTDFGTPVTLNLVSNDLDADGDDLTIVSIGGDPDGDVEISGDLKSITYTPADGFSGDDSFTYTVSDGETEDVAGITITVGEADNSAPMAMDDEASTTEDNSVAIDVLGNDEDAEDDDLNIASFGQGTNGSVADDGEGQLVYTPDADFNGEDSFTYTISDGALESTATVSVTVDAVNDAPEAGELGPFDVAEDDEAQTYNVLAVATDIDDSDLDITGATASWSGGELNVATTDSGISFDPSQLGELLNAGDTGIVTVSYTVSDGEASDDGSFIINVAGADEEVEGPNVIEGTSGNDLLRGTDEADMLISLAGSYDRMMGGAGEDIFVFGSEGSNGMRERDLIMDFEVGVDTICLDVDDYGVRVLGATGLITYGEDLIYVRGSSFTQEELENSIQIGCTDDLIT